MQIFYCLLMCIVQCVNETLFKRMNKVELKKKGGGGRGEGGGGGGRRKGCMLFNYLDKVSPTCVCVCVGGGGQGVWLGGGGGQNEMMLHQP